MLEVMGLQEGVYIVGVGSMSALGATPQEVAQSYERARPCFRHQESRGQKLSVAALSSDTNATLESFVRRNPRYTLLDRTVQLGLFAARAAFSQTGWSQRPQERVGVMVGSSRGATHLFEKYHNAFLAERRLPGLTSPTTTLGNLSTWIAQEIMAEGPQVELSNTCSTSLTALASAFAWLKSGMLKRFLVGGAEAPLTDFTLAQMSALHIYSSEPEAEFPCRPSSMEKNNTMVLGEGANMLALERLSAEELRNRKTPPLARIEAVGLGFEAIQSPTSISAEGHALQRCMQQALDLGQNRPELVIAHTPGTALGDDAEWGALQHVFGEDMPLISNNKWIMGHTLGAAGVFAIEYALWALQNQKALTYPWPVPFDQTPRTLKSALVNAAGFGGQAASVLLSSV